MSPKKSIEISFVTPGSRGFSVFAQHCLFCHTAALTVFLAFTSLIHASLQDYGYGAKLQEDLS